MRKKTYSFLFIKTFSRYELAWKDVCKTVPELKKLIDTAASIASFFHNSAVRTKELQKTAENKKLNVSRFPQYFEVRWTQFSLQLLNSILKSWHALVIYLQDSKDDEARGFLNFLTDKNNLELLTFLADVLEIFARGQKNLQKDNVSLMDMLRYVQSTCDLLSDLLKKPLLGGWVSVFNEQIKIKESLENQSETSGENAEYELKGIALNVHKRRTKTHNLYVSERRDINAVKNETIQSLKNFLKTRFDENEEKMISSLEKFSKFDPEVDLQDIHKCIGSDLDLSDLQIQFSEILSLGLDKEMINFSLIEKIKALLKAKEYEVVVTVLARIAAAKPHSADVERLISANNILKSAHRCSLDVKTENLYLYVYFNMPTLELWDPRPAIVKFIELKNRRKKDTPKAKDQDWYGGIFHKRTVEKDDDKTNMTTNEAPKKKIKSF